ncbi:MAG TPA: CBS domain-containing protein [Candidatus Sumerlaeota bacterium]|nr:CBS domain-containing protein [Candidatus Sumerlaeota bacterium]
MTGNILARDLMKTSFLRVGTTHTLREALAILLSPTSRSEGPRVFVILNLDGTFAGTLSLRYLLKALVPDWAFDDAALTDPKAFEEKLLAAMPERLDMTVSEAMKHDQTFATPTDRLPKLIQLMQSRELQCLPVLDHNRVAGVLYLNDVFRAAAHLALTTQSESS